VILIGGDEDDGGHGDDIPGFIEGDNFSVIHITKNCTRKTLCYNILRGKKEIVKERMKDLYGLVQKGMNKLTNKKVNKNTNEKEGYMDFSNQ